MPATGRLAGWRAGVTTAMLTALALVLVQDLVGLGSAAERTIGRFADDVVVTLAAGLCLLRVLNEPRQRDAWLLLCGALIVWTGCTAYESLLLWERPRTQASPADAAYLGIYPLSLGALLCLARHQFGRLDLRLGIDVLIGALALLAFIAGRLLDAASDGSDLLTAVVGVAYPVGDLLLVALAVAIGSANRWRLERLWLVLITGFLATVVGDLLYAADLVDAAADHSSAVAALWSCGVALIGCASWIPSPPAIDRRRSAGAIGLPVVLAFGALALVAYSSVRPVEPASVLLAAGSLCACLVRLSLTHRDNAVLLGEADEHAHVDPLTGLGNRRAFTRDAERLLSELRPGHELRLALFDLDGFKSYNDRDGHLAGDELLARFSRQLRDAVGGAGRCYRLGGDEFCLLAEAPAGSPDALTQQAADALADHRPAVGVECSHGSVTVGPGMDLTGALRLADERMYANKRAKRDEPIARVVYVDSPGDRRAAAHRRAAAGDPRPPGGARPPEATAGAEEPEDPSAPA